MKMEEKERDEAEGQEVPVRVVDRRRFQHMAEAGTEGAAASGAVEEPPDRRPAYVQELEEELRASRQRLEETLSAYRRAQEEFEQVRARLDRDFLSRVGEAKGRLLCRMLEVADEIERALAASKQEAGESALTVGLELIQKKLFTVLEGEGLERLDLEGQPFDPALAEAIAVVEVGDPQHHDRVVSVVQPGYRLDGKVVRPARVQVGRYVE